MTEPIDTVLADFRRTTEVSLARIEGNLALLLQRQDQQERRTDTHDTRIGALDNRLDQVERNQVTRADMDERSRRTIAWLGVVMTIVSVLTATATTIIIAIIN